MTTGEVADLLGLSRKTVYRAIRDKQLRARKFRGAWRVLPEDAEAWETGRSDGEAVTVRQIAGRRASGLRAKLLAIEKGSP